MPLDWNRIGSGTPTLQLLRPRDIFAALPSKPWPYLRQEQGEVLQAWFDRRTDRDVVIKQNTGGGKTVVGLLIAQSTLNEGIGKAVYLAPDRYLAQRVREEAARMGLATAEEPDELEFSAGRAVLVTTFQKLVNGMSRFGVVGGRHPRIDLGVIVIDDAHAALATTEDVFRLAIPAAHPTYRQLADLFADAVSQQSPKVWLDITGGDTTAVARIPFWSWADQHEAVLDILHPHQRDEELKFGWPLIGDCLQLCTAMISSRGIEVRPPCPPIAKIPSFVTAARRVYLTATLSDDSIVVTDLKADPANIEHVVTPGSAADLGDRLVLAPLELNPSLSDDAIRHLARDFAIGDRDGDGRPDARPVNVVILVPSDAAAANWNSFADHIYHVDDLERGVAELKDRHVGVVVLVNKYDGIDLPKTACELLIIDGIPRPRDAVERREAVVLHDSPASRARDVARIEQGMGRGVRDVDDHCAVLLMGAGLAVAVHDDTWLTHFSPATRAQLELSRQVALQVKGEGLDGVRAALTACLDRDAQWVEHSKRALAPIRYLNTGAVRPEAVAIREAFDLALGGQTSAAADRLQKVIGTTTNLAVRGWLREQRATYLHFTDPAAAQKQLGQAVSDNPACLRPAVGVGVGKTRAAAVQARAAAEYLAATYSDNTALVLGVQKVLDDIVWDEERTKDAEAAWAKLGLHLGFASTRPEQLYDTGPDNLWALSPARHAVIELKTGRELTCAGISKHDCDQLGGSIRWNQDNNPEASSVPLMIHPTATLDARAVLVDGMRVITPDKLDELKASVVAFVTALAEGAARWSDPDAVAEQLTHHKLVSDRIIVAHSTPARR